MSKHKYKEIDLRTDEEVAYVIECNKCEYEIPVYFGNKCRYLRCPKCRRVNKI